MKYDFTTVLDRHGRDSRAWDGPGSGPKAPGAPKDGFDLIPMWVADMNFPCYPGMIAAMTERLAHPCFGYFSLSDRYFNAIMDWQRDRNGVADLSPEHIGYENGVLGGVVSALNVLCSRGDNVLVHSPTYVGFTAVLENNGYHVIHSPLRKDETETWRMDYEDMERKIRENNIHVLIFCSPHNPLGRVWEREEIRKAAELCEKYDVTMISDEIWSDIITEGFRHIPTQSVSDYAREHTVALYATTKTFNMAGLVGSYHIIYNRRLRERILKESSLSHYNSVNVLSMHALIGAYTREGQEWVDELRSVITENIDYSVNYIREHFRGVSVSRPEGTYMLFPDCAQWLQEHGRTLDELERAAWDVGVAFQDGRRFFGKTNVRINLASPKSRIEEAFRRLDRYVFHGTEG